MLTPEGTPMERPILQGSIEFVSREGIAPSEKLRDLAPPDLLHEVRGMKPHSFLLIQEEFAGIADSQGSEAQFFLLPRLGRGREASAHGVAFGELGFTSTRDSGTEFVAVKPFDDDVRRAVHEYGAIEYVNGLHPNSSRPLSLRPLGFFHGENNDTSLVTAYDNSVKTWDQIFWNPHRTPSLREVRRALTQSAYSLGGGHLHLTTHGDARAKNEGEDRIGIRYIDLESLRRYRREEGDELRKAVIEDLGQFLGSLNVIVKDADGEDVVLNNDYTTAVESDFVTPYLKITQSPRSPLPEVAQISSAEIMSLYSSDPTKV